MSFAYLSSLCFFSTTKTLQAEPAKKKTCYLVRGGIIVGGFLNETDFFAIGINKFSGFEIAKKDKTGTLVKAINTKTSETKVKANIVGGKLVLRSHREISIEFYGAGGSITGLDKVKRKTKEGRCPK